MKTVGIIAEFNPFHNGHKYLIESAKVQTGADRVVVIMSGDFVQRGEPAILPKSLRSRLALLSGADLILELPVFFSSGSAEFFAEGAVSLLESTGIIDCLAFGAETDDKEGLQSLAEVLCEEPEEYRRTLREHLKAGASYPAARQMALSSFFQEMNLYDASSLLEEPNNILAVEYLKALYRHNSPIEPFPVKRIGESHHDTALPCDTMYASGTAIRNTLCQDLPAQELLHRIELYLPYTYESEQLWKEEYKRTYPIILNDFSLLMKYALLRQSRDSLLTYQDFSEELANRVVNHLPQYQNLGQFLDLLKTKEMTMSRVKRALLHVMLGIKAGTARELIENDRFRYLHVLGCAKRSMDLVSSIAASNIPLLIQASDLEKLSEEQAAFYRTDQFASRLYNSVITDKYQTVTADDYAKKFLII